MIYGYCRISTPKQSIERQVRNILKEYPEAHIVKEVPESVKFMIFYNQLAYCKLV